jgi:hypothetical protein
MKSTMFTTAKAFEWTLLLLACSYVAACDGARSTRYFGADAITAWVMDAETGTPVDNANVIAAWQLMSGFEGQPRHYVMVMEAVTDKDGRFHFPAWGPKATSDPGQIESAAPVLIIFKPGYRLTGGSNIRKLPDPDLHMTSIWNGKVFKLERFLGTNNDYAEYLSMTLDTRLDSLMRYGCHGRSIPKFLLAFDRQSRAFVEQRTTRELADLQYLSDRWARICGPIAAFVREAGR